MEAIKILRGKGYPMRIKDEYGCLTLVDIQPLLDGEFEAIYRGVGGDRVVDFGSLKFYEVVEI